MKKLLSMLLVLSLLFTGMLFATPVAIADEPSFPPGLTGELSQEDMQEILLAVDFGLVPAEMTGNYHDPVSYKNMEALARNAVEKFYGTKIDIDLSALELSPKALSINRLQAAIFLTEATRAAWGEYPWPNGGGWRADIGDRLSMDDSVLWEASPHVEGMIRLWERMKWPLPVISALFALCQADKVTGKFLIPFDQEYCFNPSEPMTQVAAIQAALRLYRSFDPKPVYVSFQDVPKHTIPQALYQGDSALPEASNQKIPAWRGVMNSPKSWINAQALGNYNDLNYRKSDLKAMHDAGLNMVCIYINSTRLGWPYGYEDARTVNLVELELLDQVIGWAFEFDMHVQLGFSGIPVTSGVRDGTAPFSAQFESNRLFEDDETAELFTDGWRLLAKRYADIPNKYLGFKLYNEIDPPSDAEYARVFGPVVDAIWAESPDRLITADIHSGNITGQSMAKKGVALCRHQYALPLLDYNLNGPEGNSYMALYPGYEKELSWPLLYLPSMLHGGNRKAPGNKITLEGEFSNGLLTIGVNQASEENEELRVAIDGVVVLAERVATTGERNVWSMLRVHREYSVLIPEGARKIELFTGSEDGILVYNRLQITQTGQKDTVLFPHDAFNVSWEPESVTITIGKDGNLDANRVITWDDIRKMGGDISYDSIQAMAERYGVGFIVGEVGPFGENGLPMDVLAGYLTMLLDGIQSDGVAWCHGQLIGRTGLLLDQINRLPDDAVEPLEDSPYDVNVWVRDIFRRYADGAWQKP